METTKKLNETPLLQEMNKTHSYVVVDDNGNVSRIRDVAKEYVTETELNDFIKPYDDRITTNETNISDLETNIGSTKTDVLDLESYMDIVTPKNTASGEIAYTTDALPLPTFGTKSDGQVEQVTTQGKQLYNYKDTITMVTHTVDEDDWITIAADNTNGTAEIYKNLFTNKSDLLKENTNYKCVLEIKNISQSDKTKGSYITMLGVETVTQFQKAKTIKLNELSIGTFVYDALTKESFEETSMMARNFIAISIGDSVSITFRLSVIEDTTVTPETFVYENYTGAQASPNPDYQQPIEMLEGYNLLKLTTFSNNSKEQTKNGVTATINDNGTITCKGTATDTTFFYFTKNNLDFTLGDGYFACNSPSTNQRIEFVCNVDGVDRYLNSYGKGMFIKATTSFEFKHITMYFTKGEKVDTTFTPMFAKGRYNKPFVPYGCIGIRNSKNQLLDFNGTESYSGINKTFENDVLTVSGDGSTAYHSWSKNINHICFANPGKTLYFDYEDIKSASSCNGSVVQLNVRYNDGTQPLYLGIVLRNFTKKDVWTIPNDTSNIEEVSIGVYTSNASPAISNTITITKPRLSFYENSEYEPYKEQIVYLDLKGNWVGAINDTIKDYLVTDKKKFWLPKNIGRVIFDGRENWETWGVNKTTEGITGFYSYDTNDFIQGTYWLSNYFIYNTNAWGGGEIGICASGKGTKYVYISVKNELLNDVSTNEKAIASFKTWLKEQYDNGTPVIAYYQLVEPQIIELGELPEPIKTFEGTNNIQLLANLDTEIEVVYAQDVKKYIDSKLAEISAQII